MKKLFRLAITFFALITILFISSCSRPAEKQKVYIAVSKGWPVSSYSNYYNWIHSIDSTVVPLDMYHLSLDSVKLLLPKISGLLLTGGTDLNPAYYGKAADSALCTEPDPHRDSLEFFLIDQAMKRDMPILGICRGEQVLNVALGGNLYIDLPTDLGTAVVHQMDDYEKCFHPVKIETNSLLHLITGLDSGIVNSNHHQGIKVLAPGLRASAHTADGLVEAIEWKDPGNKSYLIAVQWHPERMNLSNPLSGKIGHSFLEEVEIYHNEEQEAIEGFK
jgi:putative glutamine amidotransferase